jgi:hypothetical protein
MDINNDEKKMSGTKKNQTEVHPLDDGEMLSQDLIKEGSQAVEKQGGCYESMSEEIMNGLISLLEKLLKNPMFKNKMKELLGIVDEPNKNINNKEKEKGKSIIGRFLDKLISFFKGDRDIIKEKDRQLTEANTLINNQNIEMTKLKTQHESLESENKFLRTQVGNNVELIKIIEKLIEKLLEIPTMQQTQNDKTLKDVQEEQAAIKNMTN